MPAQTALAQEQAREQTRSLFAHQRHARFFNFHIRMLPVQYTTTDTVRLAFVFFCIAALDTLGCLPYDDSEEKEDRESYGLPKVSEEQCAAWRDWIYDTCLLPSRDAFRCSPALSTGPSADTDTPNIYDPGHAAGTYFALATLLILRDDFSRIDRPAMMRFLSSCQRADGSFATGVLLGSNEHFGERDLRFGYCAAAARWIIGGDEIPGAAEFDLEAARRYIVAECVAYDGGIGMGGFTESHGGLSYCGVGTLELLSRGKTAPREAVAEAMGEEGLQELVRWCLMHQTTVADEREAFTDEEESESEDEDEDEDGLSLAGFNGRFNKPSDTCYSFWVGGTLAMLPSRTHSTTSALTLSDVRSNAAFLLQKTQNTLLGGFAKCPGRSVQPDALHAFFGIAALALSADVAREEVGVEEMKRDEVWCGLLGLKGFDGALCIPADAVRYAEGLRRGWREGYV
ncbi:terpenoid cyclases/protein prenyltransferase alpha-alpha toroid [Myxozyma melibiosi]|uniref:Terpenoid cyclases/protein prenyltransferase alpha-alpha toroid n=1 Tax=Myxozyma melibiosi TaxID=54550 RepID=A0ABR1F0C6_9ASCO